MLDQETTPAADGRASPLVQCDVSAGKGELVTMSERPFLGHLNLRGDVRSAVSQSFGLTLPEEPNTMTRDGTGIALWTGPDEWLLIHRSEKDFDRVSELQQAVSGQHASVVDVSSGQTIIYLSGPGARDVLARGCPLDLHPREFKPGSCAQTHFDHVGITLWLDMSKPDPSADPWFNLVVRRSFADYLWRLLDDAADSVRASGA